MLLRWSLALPRTWDLAGGSRPSRVCSKGDLLYCFLPLSLFCFLDAVSQASLHHTIPITMYHYTTGPEISETVRQNKRGCLRYICHSYKKLSIISIKKKPSDLRLNSGMNVELSKDAEDLHNIAIIMPRNSLVGGNYPF